MYVLLYVSPNLSNGSIMNTTQVQINLNRDERLVLSKERKSKWLVPFTPIGKAIMQNPDSIDALELICSFNKGELALLKVLKDGLDRYHQVTIQKSNLSLGDNRKLTQAIKSFIKKGLLKRIRREVYMVNPFFLVPASNSQELLILEWHSL